MLLINVTGTIFKSLFARCTCIWLHLSSCCTRYSICTLGLRKHSLGASIIACITQRLHLTTHARVTSNLPQCQSSGLSQKCTKFRKIQTLTHASRTKKGYPVLWFDTIDTCYVCIFYVSNDFFAST